LGSNFISLPQKGFGFLAGLSTDLNDETPVEFIGDTRRVILILFLQR